VETIYLFNILALMIFHALSFNATFSNFLSIILIIMHCLAIQLAVIVCFYEKYRNSKRKNEEYKTTLLEEDELEIQGTHTIFESDDDDDTSLQK